MLGSNGFFATASEDTSLRIVKVEGAQQKDEPMVGFTKNIYIYTNHNPDFLSGFCFYLQGNFYCLDDFVQVVPARVGGKS